jgi:mannose-6-phosphate isomerase-like protein (cupin superfamily)
MNTLRTALLIIFFAATVGTFAQTPPAQTPAPQTPPQTPAAPRTTPSGGTTSSSQSTLAVQATDKSGNGIQGVAVAVSGPVERSGMTGSDGSISFRSMRPGTYRVRFEHERYVTLEREVTMRGASDVSVALNPAPPKPVAPPPPPTQQTTAPPEQRKLRPVEPRTMSIPDYLDKNVIRSSEPQKASLIACTDGGTARTLQVREPMTNQQNDIADQLLYVVAGAGTVRVKDQSYKADAGWFALIPRGVSHSIAREGRNPLFLMMVAMGAPCTDTTPLAR